MKSFTGIGRAELIQLIRDYQKEVAELREHCAAHHIDRKATNIVTGNPVNWDDGYSSGFKHGKEAEAASGIRLRGWNCPRCKVFNGEEKEQRRDCRSCGYEKSLL